MLLSGFFVFLQLTVLPVYAETSVVFNSSASDGAISSGVYADYAGEHNNQSGTPTNDTATFLIGQLKSGANYVITRGFVYFNTASITASYTVTSAVLSFNFSAIATNNFTLTVKDCGTTYPHDPMVAGDYAISNYSSMTTCATFDTVGITALKTYINVSLTEFSGINKVGTTRFALLSDKDLSATAPTASERVTIYANESSSSARALLNVTYTQTIPSTPPTINDFYVTGTNSSGNVTWAGFPGMFSFNISDSVALDHAIFGSNNTGSWVNNANTTLAGVGPTFDNYTLTFNSTNCFLAFNYTVWNTNTTISATTGLRVIKLYSYNATSGAWNTPFQNLATAITTVEAANVWSQVENYTQTMLDQQTSGGSYVSVTTSLSNLIDGFNAATNPELVLSYSSYCNKLNITRQAAIKNALGNYTMVGYLPFTGNDSYLSQGITPAFSPGSKWALYGFWYNNASWIGSYQNNTKWNITAAYNQFDTAVNWSVANYGPTGSKGLPLFMYSNNTGFTYGNRYYDEVACTLDCYMIFYTLLNVSDALNKVLYWWSYVNTNFWDGTYYHYTPVQSLYECESSFFLKVISIIKYNQSDLGNWTNVLDDIGNRFLSNGWNSKQWLDYTNNVTSYVVTHAWGTAGQPNNQRRLANTLAAWQTLLGCYAKLNSTYQANMKDMLYGNSNVQPAWANLLSPDNASFASAYPNSTGAGLFNITSNLFSFSSADNNYAFANNYNATAIGEELLFMLGIVPGNTTVAFPLEELGYEYLYDADPVLLQFQLNSTLKEIRISVIGSDNGTLTFQYGTSPITVTFNGSGVYYVRFTNSWNMLLNSSYPSYQGALPTNVIYFSSLNPPPTILDLRLSGISDTTNITQIDTYTWYDWEINVTDAESLNDIANVTIRIKDTPSDSIVSASPAYNRTGEYWFTYLSTTNVWNWYSGATWTATSDWLDNANCAYPTKTETSGYYLFRVKLAKSAVQGAAWAFQAYTYDSSNNVASKNFTAITVNAYSSLVILAGNTTHTWANALGGTNDNLLDQGAIYFNVTANFLYKIQAKGSGNLLHGSDYMVLANVTIHKDTLASSIPLTTGYADVGGLTSQALGEDVTLSLKVWLDVPSNQPVGDYVYTLTMQITS